MTDRPGRRAPAGRTAAQGIALCGTGLVAALLAGAQGVRLAAAAGPRVEAAQNTAGTPATPSYSLRVSRDAITTVSLTADGAKLSEIAADLSRRLNARVMVGATLANQTVSTTFSDLPLEPALSAFAARVYIDYEIRQGVPAVPQGIYLLGDADPQPAANAVVSGATQGLLITGNTEDTEKAPADDPLLVRRDGNRLTVVSKQQPLALVVMAIGDVLGVPADIKYEATEIVESDIRDALPEDSIPRLSANIRLYVRVEVSSGRRTLLRLAVVPPAGR